MKYKHQVKCNIHRNYNRIKVNRKLKITINMLKNNLSRTILNINK